jgi:type I restriction enzyme S subunit
VTADEDGGGRQRQRMTTACKIRRRTTTAKGNSGGQENLSQGLIQGLQFSYPKDAAEQRRIADCLTSLDDLIDAQTQNLEALKTHKKGLMQQLFPSPEN